MKNEGLRMSFDPKTIEHLGIKMYSRLPNAIAELIANAYDACAKEVIVYLEDADNDKKIIIVEDDGEGMTFDEINEKFLRIGRNRREEGFSKSSCERIATGRKGLGKLAFFGIGKEIQITTCKEGNKVTFELLWDDLISTQQDDYQPKSFTEPCGEEKHGTIITLRKLKRKTKFDFDNLTKSLAKLFNFQEKFTVLLSYNKSKVIEIDNKLKYEDLVPEFSWSFPKDISALIESQYEYSNEISGVIFTTEKPIKPAMRGITLFSNGRMINSPEFFGSSESSHFFSYTTGWIDVNFVDNWDEDVIATNRQSIDWEHEKTFELKKILIEIIKNVHMDWRQKRKEKRRERVQVKTAIDLNEWIKTLPAVVKNEIENIVDKVDDSELSENQQSSTIQSLHTLIPHYPFYHWRYIHSEIKIVSEFYYQNQDYYTAFLEALKRYIAEVRSKSGSTNSSDRSMMGEVFNGRILSVTQGYQKSDGDNFSVATIENIEAAQHHLSEGIIEGGRNPLSHEIHKELTDSGLFTEKDCLDLLSLLSHLFKRLDDASPVV